VTVHEDYCFSGLEHAFVAFVRFVVPPKPAMALSKLF
jgi:hypothetical protein